MVRASNAVITILNSIFLVSGIALIGGGVYFHAHASTICQKSLQNPLLVLGGLVLGISLLGLIGSCCKKNFLLGLYLFLMLLFIFGLIGFTIFAFIVTNKDAGKVLSNRGYKQYKLGDYSHWLQNHFVKGKNWDLIRACLADANVCQLLVTDHDPQLSPIQSGCCKPPADCGFTSMNATFWTAPASGPAMKNSDCTTWSNDIRNLCYNCNSCKAGFLDNIRAQWKSLAIVLVCLCIFELVVFWVGCCAKRNNNNDNKYKYRHFP